MRKAKKEMKIYYKGVLFRHWLKAIKSNARDNKRKVSEFYKNRCFKKFFNIWKKNYLEIKQRKSLLNKTLNKYFTKIKRISFKTLKIETKYKES